MSLKVSVHQPTLPVLYADAALENLFHQFCAFAARHNASNTFEGAARSCSSSEFLNSGHSAPDMHIPQVSRSAESGIPYRAFTRSSKRTAKRVPARPICLFRVICGAAPDTITGINVRLLQIAVDCIDTPVKEVGGEHCMSLRSFRF